eukprot:591002-Alexandrium_andersonii.AAC.1
MQRWIAVEYCCEHMVTSGDDWGIDLQHMGYLADLFHDHANLVQLPTVDEQRWVMNDRQWRQVCRVLPHEFLEDAEEVHFTNFEQLAEQRARHRSAL